MQTVDTTGRVAPDREVAERMARAAAAWLACLDAEQRRAASWAAPGSDAEAERLRWFYTPTDHGGLPLGGQRPAQQSRALQLVATGLSTAGYVTVCTVIGWENVLDHVEGFEVDWGRERGRDPGLYYLRVFGDPTGDGPWGWRFGGHHVSLNNLVVDGRVRSVTPCFLGADPAGAPLLGGTTLRPLGATEDLARELVRSLDRDQLARAVLLDRAPSDIVGGNRTQVRDGDRMLLLADVWRGRFTEPRLVDRIAGMDERAEAASGYDDADHGRLALTSRPKGLPASELDDGQRDLLRRLVAAHTDRVPEGLAAVPDPSELHIAWAGPTEPGRPHYFRLQGPRFLAEWDNTQRGANHAHSVWRDPGSDFGIDVLAAHRAAHHAG
ncbi:DUF3500 domain-containing protein [Geodermatophilus sp. YIM 151500]|uniref:DUF3500 domain-containing protein n=1 Tax=Geodermatophilus sp. YIM 151500 TaxID=2984531 RepID=UPI0021E3ED65|nr:DUF3500 domain-containing protein [Geodermatophilus sp. YIM 151500]MCV2488878.1 DUF3500 domain-containing protein [Geodermatophilus sp. YIM 151500]